MLDTPVLCPVCSREMENLVCRACQADRQRTGMLQHQRRFLETWLEGTIDLRVSNKNGVPHLQLFDDRWHTYCGQDLFGITNRDFVRVLPRSLCPDCVAVFDSLIAKVKAGG